MNDYKVKCVCGNRRSKYSSYCRSCASRVRTWGEDGNLVILELARKNEDMTTKELMLVADKYYTGKGDKENRSALKSAIRRSLEIAGYTGQITGIVGGVKQSYTAYRNRLMQEARTGDFKKDCCYLCGVNNNLVLHHIMPISWGGKSTKENCVTLCGECHRRAHKSLRKVLNTNRLIKYLAPHKSKIRDDAVASFEDLL